MTFALGRSIETVLKDIDLNQYIHLTDNIPLEPSAFYSSFGYLRHPRTKKPVRQLTEYQLKVWRALHESKRVLVVLV